MNENTENSKSQQQSNYIPYGGFQSMSSYDPNMCTTAPRFSPYYDQRNATLLNHQQTYKSPTKKKSLHNNHENIATNSRIVDSSYLIYNNDNDYHQDNNTEVVLVNSATFDEQTSKHNNVDFIQQSIRGNEVETTETIATSVVMHRSPNGHLYQNFYVTNEAANSDEIVELIPIDPIDDTDNQSDSYALQSYDQFPIESRHNEHVIESHSQSNHIQTNQGVEYEEHQEQMIPTEILTREQQRILLESTMSPLLAAVNDITQRDKQYLPCPIQENMEHDDADYRSNQVNQSEEEDPDIDDDDDDYIIVPDRVVESLARATLPINYLYLGPIQIDTNEPSVFAAKKIARKTKFGPFVGEVRNTNDIFLNILKSQQPRHYPLLLVGQSRILIVTNENTSNWMRFVRLAETFSDKNLEICEENNRLFFKCIRDIHPREELRVGYHSCYAEKYNLPFLEPSLEDTRKKYERDNPWMCFECDQRFPTSHEMQAHLKVHDLEDASCVISKRKIKRKPKKIRKISELPKNSSRCLICFKVFMTNASLKKHFALHIAAKRKKTKATKTPKKRLTELHKCALCPKRFKTESKLKLHQGKHNMTHKPHKCPQCDQHCATPTALAAHIRSHTNRLYSCVFCQESFKYVMEFKKHVSKHKTDGLFTCFHCKKNYKEYHRVRRHIRIIHPTAKYPCNECDRSFLHKNLLRRHKLIHAKTDTIQCPLCEQKFFKDFELKHHLSVFHKEKTKTKKLPLIETKNETSIRQPKILKEKENHTTPIVSENYYLSQFKCETCRLGFKRRGMLVNHLVRRHPEQNVDSIEELNQPIVKLQTMFKCPYCPKLYKNNAKRKCHIIKNHPGMDIPASFRKNPVLIDPNVQTVGCIKTDVQKCHLCYKQYVTRIRLVAHYRKSHPEARVPLMPNVHLPIQIESLMTGQCIEPVMDIYRQPPVSPENKLLKLSSAALELSSIEDRKYFDFLNERSDTTDNIGNRDVDVMEENVFVESSSNADLNRLPELFEESIACI